MLPVAVRRWYVSVTVLLLFLFTGIAGARTLPQGVEQNASVEGVTQYTLGNGLRVLLAPDPSRANITVNMTYLVGARHENYGQTGMAHLLEHMLFRGTPTLRNALAEFSKRGLAANGTTNSDRTNYYASFAANPETLDWYLRWQADAMVNALILKEDLDSEMTVVRNEMERGENSPFQMLMQKMQAASFQWHSYGKSTIGARSDVENVDIEQLRAFYKQYYQPDNAVLIITGKFDADATLATVAEAFGNIPRPSRRLPPEYTVEPVQDGERLVTLRRQGGSPLVAATYHAPAGASEAFAALDVATAIVSDTPSGPLYKQLVDAGLATQVFGFGAEMRQPGYVFFGAQLNDAMDPQKAFNALTSVLESAPENTFTQEALERIRNRWLAGWSQIYADPSQLASALSEAVAAGDWRLFFLQRDRLETLTLPQVTQAAADYLVTSNRTGGLYIPTEQPNRAPESRPVDINALVHDYQGRETAQAVEAFEATPAAIDALTQRDTLTLRNGTVQLALLPKPTRGNRVEARLLLQFGNADSLKGKQAIAQATASLLANGTSQYGRQEIEDRFTALEASVDISGGAGVVTVSLSTTSENLPDALRLALHLLKQANFPEKELLEYQKQVDTAISNAKSDPSALASRRLARHDNPWPVDDVRYTPTFDEAQQRVAALSRDQLVDFHQSFYGAGTLRFSAVGRFEPDAVKQVLADELNDWRQAPAYERLGDPYRNVPAETFFINTPDKANAILLAAGNVEMQDTDPDYPALMVANYLLGGSETSRLWNRIRVEEGLSYSVGSSLDVSSYEPSGNWSLYAIHAPENTGRLRDALKEELNKALTEGFSEQEVRESVTALLNYRKLARSRDGVLASAWLNYLQLNRTFAWSAAIDDKLQALSADEVNNAFRRYFKPRTLSTAIAGDQAKQGNTTAAN
ncbi:MAG: M16 family metallopeptidase [Burkholderiaceae bacterium]